VGGPNNPDGTPRPLLSPPGAVGVVLYPPSSKGLHSLCAGQPSELSILYILPRLVPDCWGHPKGNSPRLGRRVVVVESLPISLLHFPSTAPSVQRDVPRHSRFALPVFTPNALEKRNIPAVEELTPVPFYTVRRAEGRFFLLFRLVPSGFRRRFLDVRLTASAAQEVRPFPL